MTSHAQRLAALEKRRHERVRCTGCGRVVEALPRVRVILPDNWRDPVDAPQCLTCAAVLIVDVAELDAGGAA